MKKVRGARRENELLVTLCVMVALVMVGRSLVSPILPLYGRTFGVNGALIGLIVSAYPIARLLTNTPAGRLADRFGRGPLLLAGMAFTVSSAIVCGLAPVYAVLLCGRFLAGIGSALFITSAPATIADISTAENRGRMMSTFQGSFLLGSTTGPSIGGVIARVAGARGVFFAYSGVTLRALAWTYRRRRTFPGSAVVEQAALQAAPRPRRASPFAAWRSLSDASFLAICLVALAQFYTRTGTRTTALPLLGADRYPLGEEAIGGILTLVARGNLVCVPRAGWMVDNLGRKAAIVPSTLLSGVSVVCFIASPISMGFVSRATGYSAARGITAALIITTGLFFALVARETGGRRARAKADAARNAATKRAAEPIHGDD